MTFGEKIRLLRRDNKLSQRDLAGRVGFDLDAASYLPMAKDDASRRKQARASRSDSLAV